MEVLGPSLEDLRRGKSGRARLSGAPFLRVGRGVLRLLRRLHAAGLATRRTSSRVSGVDARAVSDSVS